MITNTNRPKFLNLLQIHLPVTGLTSIAHRISGALLFLSLPYWVYLFDLFLRNDAGYVKAVENLQGPLVKILLSVLLWSTVHHLLAGIRFLLMDIEIGDTLKIARMSASLVNYCALLLSLLLIVTVIWL